MLEVLSGAAGVSRSNSNEYPSSAIREVIEYTDQKKSQLDDQNIFELDTPPPYLLFFSAASHCTVRLIRPYLEAPANVFKKP